MPSKSKAQHNFMAAVANNPSFAKKAGVPQSVGKEFTTADKNRKFSKGGDTMATKMGKPVMKKGMSMAKDGMKKPCRLFSWVLQQLAFCVSLLHHHEKMKQVRQGHQERSACP